MSEFVRVRAENGAEVSIPAGHAEAAGQKPLSKPAVGNDGRVLPTKLRVPKGADQPTTSTQQARPASDRPKEG